MELQNLMRGKGNRTLVKGCGVLLSLSTLIFILQTMDLLKVSTLLLNSRACSIWVFRPDNRSGFYPKVTVRNKRLWSLCRSLLAKYVLGLKLIGPLLSICNGTKLRYKS